MQGEQTQSAGFYEFLAWFEVNKKKVLYWAIGVVVLASIVSIWNHQRGEKEAEALRALASIHIKGGPGEEGVFGSSDQYLKIVQNYSGTRAAFHANYLAGV